MPTALSTQPHNPAESSRRIRVLCVDDNEDLCQVVERLIEGQTDMENVGSVQSADSLCVEIKSRRPDVVLVDLTMPGRRPLDAVREMSASDLGARVIVLSGYDSPEHVSQAMDAGAWGYLSKNGSVPDMLSAIRGVASGETWFDHLV